MENYIVDDKVKLLWHCEFGVVFQTRNKHDSNIKLAIKVLDKHKLRFARSENKYNVNYLKEIKNEI